MPCGFKELECCQWTDFEAHLQETWLEIAAYTIAASQGAVLDLLNSTKEAEEYVDHVESIGGRVLRHFLKIIKCAGLSSP